MWCVYVCHPYFFLHAQTHTTYIEGHFIFIYYDIQVNDDESRYSSFWWWWWWLRRGWHRCFFFCFWSVPIHSLNTHFFCICFGFDKEKNQILLSSSSSVDLVFFCLKNKKKFCSFSRIYYIYTKHNFALFFFLVYLAPHSIRIFFLFFWLPPKCMCVLKMNEKKKPTKSRDKHTHIL